MIPLNQYIFGKRLPVSYWTIICTTQLTDEFKSFIVSYVKCMFTTSWNIMSNLLCENKIFGFVSLGRWLRRKSSLNNIFDSTWSAAMKFNPHWYVTVPSCWAETNVLCLDQGIQIMGNNSVSVVVSTKFLCSFKFKKKKWKPGLKFAMWNYQSETYFKYRQVNFASGMFYWVLATNEFYSGV